MLNFESSDEYKKILPALTSSDRVEMQDVATGAFKVTDTTTGNVYKLRLLNDTYARIAHILHAELLNHGFLLPKIVERYCEVNDNFAWTEWIEGKSFWELYNSNELTNDDYYKLGEFVGKVNRITFYGKYISFLNYFHKNCFRRSDGEVIVIDTNKLYLTDFPQAFIDKYIITEDIVTFSQRQAFLAGYRKHSVYNYQTVMEWHYNNIFDQSVDMDIRYFDVNINSMASWSFEGARSHYSREKLMALPKDMTGMRVLDLRCRSGMTALACALANAEYIYAVDCMSKNIENRHHRTSDMTKLMAYMYGFDGRHLHFKHVEMNSDWFIDEHIPKMQHFDIAFALDALSYFSKKGNHDRKLRILKMLERCSDTLYFEGEPNQTFEYIKKLFDGIGFKSIELLGQTTDHNLENTYVLVRCSH